MDLTTKNEVISKSTYSSCTPVIFRNRQSEEDSKFELLLSSISELPRSGARRLSVTLWSTRAPSSPNLTRLIITARHRDTARDCGGGGGGGSGGISIEINVVIASHSLVPTPSRAPNATALLRIAALVKLRSQGLETH